MMLGSEVNFHKRKSQKLLGQMEEGLPTKKLEGFGAKDVRVVNMSLQLLTKWK